jgi:hypothetical protein
MKAAASKPAEESLISFVKRYVKYAVSPEKAGASMTQMFLISTGKPIFLNACQMEPLVTMSPGYRVPPVTLPSGYQVLSSNQLRNS